MFSGGSNQNIWNLQKQEDAITRWTSNGSMGSAGGAGGGNDAPASPRRPSRGSSAGARSQPLSASQPQRGRLPSLPRPPPRTAASSPSGSVRRSRSLHEVEAPVPLPPPALADEDLAVAGPTPFGTVGTVASSQFVTEVSEIGKAPSDVPPELRAREGGAGGGGYAADDGDLWAQQLRSLDKKLDQVLSLLRFFDDSYGSTQFAFQPSPAERPVQRRGGRTKTWNRRNPPITAADSEPERPSATGRAERITGQTLSQSIACAIEAAKEEERTSGYDDEGRLSAVSQKSQKNGSKGVVLVGASMTDHMSRVTEETSCGSPKVNVRTHFETLSDEKEERSVGTATSETHKDKEYRINPSTTATTLMTDLARKRRNSAVQIAVGQFLNDPESGKSAGIFARVWSPFIMLSFLVSLLQTLDAPLVSGIAPSLVESSFEVVFLVESVMRFAGSRKKRRFLLDIYNLIDAVSGLPLLVRVQRGFFMLNPDGSCLTTCAILVGFVPVIRLLKFLRRFQNFHLLLQAFRLAIEALPVLLFIWGSMALTSSAALFIIEPRNNIPTFAVALWCAIVSMTTVGYGDVTPVTDAGRCLIVALVVSSILYTAIPLGIIGSAFSEVWNDRDRILLMERTRKRLWQAGYEARDIPYLFKIFDADANNELDLDEFKTMLDFMKVGLQGQRVIDLFEVFDNDGSGAIDDREFVRGLFPDNYHEIYGMMTSEGTDMDGASPADDSGFAEPAGFCECGAEVYPDVAFCRKCGAASEGGSEPPAAAAERM